MILFQNETSMFKNARSASGIDGTLRRIKQTDMKFVMCIIAQAFLDLILHIQTLPNIGRQKMPQFGRTTQHWEPRLCFTGQLGAGQVHVTGIPTTVTRRLRIEPCLLSG